MPGVSMTQPPDPLKFSGADKFYHLGEYGVFALLVGRAIRKSLSPYSMLGAAVMAVALVMIVGAADEYYQSFVPGRDSSVLDWATDAGAAKMPITAYFIALYAFLSSARLYSARARFGLKISD